jgi:hypothetical protein
MFMATGCTVTSCSHVFVTSNHPENKSGGFFPSPGKGFATEAQKEKRKVQDSVPPRPSSQTYKLMSKK